MGLAAVFGNGRTNGPKKAADSCCFWVRFKRKGVFEQLLNQQHT